MKRERRKMFKPPARRFVAPLDVLAELNAAPAPSMDEAVHFLRTLAKYVEHEVAQFPGLTDEALRIWRLRLYVIAECIQGSRKWHKGSARTLEQQAAVGAAAFLRRADQTVEEALDENAALLTEQWGVRHDGDDPVRTLLKEARKPRKRRPGGK